VVDGGENTIMIMKKKPDSSIHNILITNCHTGASVVVIKLHKVMLTILKD